MTVCRSCGAFVQADWDKCKICGHASGDDIEVVPDPPSGKKGRRARPAKPAKDQAPAKPPKTPRAKAPRAKEPRAKPTTAPPRAAAPAAAPRRAAAPAPQPRTQRTQAERAPSPPWLLPLEILLFAIVIGCVFVILSREDDEVTVDPSIPAAESDPDAGDPEWMALGDWPGYQSPDGVYSVELPQPPLEATLPVWVPMVGEVERHKASLADDGMTFTVWWAPKPENLDDRPDLLLDGMVEGAATEVAGEVVASKDVTVDGDLARRVRIDGVDSDIRSVMIVGDENLYELRVQGGGEDATLHLQRLIDTFDG
jgi:hypothetical protein